MNTLRMTHIRVFRRPTSSLIALIALIAHMVAGDLWSQTTDANIALLVKPGAGDDSKARLDIRRMTNTSFRPGAETERQAQETSLLSGLAKMTDWEVKAYLMDELRFGGKTPAVEPLAGYLKDANLCEPAAMALLSIGTTEGADKVIPSIRTALVAASGKCLVTLMRAAGSLRDGNAATVDLLVKQGAGTDRNARFIALRGLANIGDPKGRVALAEALKAQDAFDRYQAVDLNLLFALRLAERGLKTEANEITMAVRQQGAAASQRNVVVHADSILEIIKKTVVVANRPNALGTARVDFRNSGGKIRVMTSDDGPFLLKITDLRGRLVRRFQGGGGGADAFAWGPVPAGMYRLTYEGASGRVSRIMVHP